MSTSLTKHELAARNSEAFGVWLENLVLLLETEVTDQDIVDMLEQDTFYEVDGELRLHTSDNQTLIWSPDDHNWV